jgi:hypothetical protein
MTNKELKERADDKVYSIYLSKLRESLQPNKYWSIDPERAKELEKAFEHIHYSDIDTDNIVVNQLAHEYLTEEVTGDPQTRNNIIVDKELYNKLSN